MTRPGSPSIEMELTFLVSRDGVATVTPARARMADARPLDPVIATELPPARRRPGKGTGPIEITFDLSEWASGDLRESIEETEGASKGGEVVALFGVVRRLAADAFLENMLVGKSRRGNRRRGNRRSLPRVAELAEMRGDTSAVKAFTQVARSCLTQVSANAQLLQRGSNREALHQLRVGVRRLRAAFIAFQPILPPEALVQWKSETRWLAGQLDAARDLDVFIAYVFRSTKADALDDPMLDAFGERLILAQAMAYDLVVATLASKRFVALLRCCTEWIEAAPWQRPNDSTIATLRDEHASVLATRALKRLRHQLRKAGECLATLDPNGRHQVRIKAKRLRYAAEFFSQTFGKNGDKRHSKFISSLTRLQDVLGELNDIAMARRCALAVAGRSPELAFCAGQIVGDQGREEPRLLAKAVQTFEQWSATKSFWS